MTRQQIKVRDGPYRTHLGGRGFCYPCAKTALLEWELALPETLIYRQQMVKLYQPFLGENYYLLKRDFRWNLSMLINKLIEYVNDCILVDLDLHLFADCAGIAASYLPLIAPQCDMGNPSRVHETFLEWSLRGFEEGYVTYWHPKGLCHE